MQQKRGAATAPPRYELVCQGEIHMHIKRTKADHTEQLQTPTLDMFFTQSESSDHALSGHFFGNNIEAGWETGGGLSGHDSGLSVEYGKHKTCELLIAAPPDDTSLVMSFRLFLAPY